MNLNRIIWAAFALLCNVTALAGTCNDLFGTFSQGRPSVFGPGDSQHYERQDSQRAQANYTLDLIEYLTWLTENRVLGTARLTELKANLRAGRFINPLNDVAAQGSSTINVYRDTLNGYINAPLEIPLLLLHVQNLISRQHEAERSKDTAKVETRISDRPMKFVRVPKGHFKKIDSQGKVVEIELTHDFEVMDTPVTQAMWLRFMKGNPSKFKFGPTTQTIVIDGIEIKFQPDHPVENLTWWSALVFANEVSKAHGFEPVYDLSLVNFNSAGIYEYDWKARPAGSPQWEKIFRIASFGDLGGPIDSAPHSRPRINAPNENIYKSRGYRLMTDAEFAYLASGLGKITVDDPNAFDFGFGLERFPIDTSAAGPGEEVTLPVGAFPPKMIGESPIHDLFGNVDNLCHDAQPLMAEKVEHSYSVDPVVERRDSAFRDKIVVRGTHRAFPRRKSGFYSHQSSRQVNERYHLTGLRLVRTLHPEDQ